MKNTNKILKKVIINAGTYRKRKLINFLAVDVQNCHPIDFTGMIYKKELHENCIFLYLNEKSQIIGILKGTTYDKSYEDYEHYYSFDLIKNKKHLTQAASSILMITPIMRTYIGKPIKNRNNKPSHKDLLNQRLIQYKAQKNKEISHEELINMAKKVLTTITNSMFTPQESEMVQKIKKVDSWRPDQILDGIRHFTQTVNDYIKSQNKVSAYSDLSSMKKEYEKQMKTLKVEIIEWHKAIA